MRELDELAEAAVRIIVLPLLMLRWGARAVWRKCQKAWQNYRQRNVRRTPSKAAKPAKLPQKGSALDSVKLQYEDVEPKQIKVKKLGKKNGLHILVRPRNNR
jgi:hypothetical protein